MQKLVILCLALFFQSAQAVDHNPGTWFGLFTKKHLYDRLSLHNEVQLRYDLDQDNTQQLLVRFGGLYEINETQEAGLLYAFVANASSNEHRLTQQFVQKLSLPETHKGLFRIRLEERVLEDRGPLTFRARIMGKYQKEVHKYFELVVWDELFINLTKKEWNGNSSFDRNRLFLGARYELANSSIEYGYLNQLVNRTTEDVVEHLAVVYFNY
jgi:hypothetical protein